MVRVGRRAARASWTRGVPLVVVVAVVLLTACQSPWAQVRFDAAQTGFNPTESKLGLAEVDDRLDVARFTLDGSRQWFDFSGPWAAPVVSGGSVYVAASRYVLVFEDCPLDSMGLAYCPLRFRADLGEGRFSGDAPAVVNGTLFIQTIGGDELLAFDANGRDGCAGTPRTCTPRWRAAGGYASSPVVRDGRVYVGGIHQVLAFDAAGQVNCGGTPKRCTPVWATTERPSAVFSRPALAGDRLYVTTRDGEVVAYDATGRDACGGTPVTCAPLWESAGPWGQAPTPLDLPAPVVADGRVLVQRSLPGNGTDRPQHLSVYATDDAACGGTPRVCLPQWETAVPGLSGQSQLAAAYGLVFVLSRTGPSDGEEPVRPTPDRLSAYPIDGSGCDPGGTCSPRWIATPPGGFSRGTSPTIANGVLYQSDRDEVLAFDARGSTCPLVSGTPTCSPVARLLAGGSDVAVVAGRVYVVATTTYEYSLPVGGALVRFG